MQPVDPSTDSYSEYSSLQRYNVDTETSRNAVRIAAQAREIATNTLVEVTIQAGLEFLFLDQVTS